METIDSEQLLGQVLKGGAMPWEAPLHLTEEYAARKAESLSSLQSFWISGYIFIPFPAKLLSLYTPGVAQVTGLHSALAMIPRNFRALFYLTSPPAPAQDIC